MRKWDLRRADCTLTSRTTVRRPDVRLFDCVGGEGWIRTSVRLRGQIYSLLPLTTRPPLHEALPRADHPSRMVEHGEAGAPCGGGGRACQRAVGAPLRFGRSINQPSTGWLDFGAGEGNRTLVVSLEGFCSTIELHPPGALGRCCQCHSPASAVNRLDPRQGAALPNDSHEAAECHRRDFDRSPVVARAVLSGAMARLIG